MTTTPQAHDHGDSNVVTLVVTVTIKPEQEQAYLDASREFILKVHQAEPGIVLYALNKHDSEPHTYVWVERYRDEAALADHVKTPHMAAIMSKVGDWLAKPPTILKLRQVLPQ